MRPLTRKFALLAMLIMLCSLAYGGVASASDDTPTFESPIVVVNTSFLNVRTGPGVQYTVLVTVVGGTELPVLGVFGDGVWYQVNTDGGPGWVNIEFTLPRGDFTNVPLVSVGETGAPNVDLGQGGGAVTTTTTVNNRVQGISLIGRDLRAQPDSESLIISRSVPNDPTTVYPLLNVATTDGTIWYQVNLPGAGIGWTVGVELRVLGCSTQTIAVTTTQTPIRFDGFEDRNSFLLPPLTEGYLGAFRGARNEFIEFELQDGTTGLVLYEDVTPRTGVTEVCQGVLQGFSSGTTTASNVTDNTQTTTPVIAGNRAVVNTPFLNLRSGPSAGFSIIATVSGGTELPVIGRTLDNVWFLVQNGSGQAWLNSQFTLFRGNYSTVPVITEPVFIEVQEPVVVTDTQESVPEVSGNRVVINTGNLNVRSGPNATFSTVATVPGGTELTVVGRATDGVWYFVEGSFGRGWVNSEFVIFRGDFGTVPVIDIDA